MRLAYFIQNHLPPPQVARLAGTILRSQPDAFLLIGHDPFAGRCTVEEMRGALDADVFGVREPPRRGYFSLIQPYFEAVEWLADHGIDYDWLVYLSGQDYPVQPLRGLENLLATCEVDGFLRYWDAFRSDNPWGRPKQGLRRYGYQYADAPGWLARPLKALNGIQGYAHAHLIYGPRLGLRRKSPFGPACTCYAGKQWTILRRACAEYVTEKVREDGKLIQWFRRTICPDEAVVQTLLANAGRFRLRDDDLRYMDFTGSTTGSPRNLTEADLPALTNGKYYFARKFERDSPVLDRLDDYIDAS
ncbi:MAG: beta-1,6-N-acetylglucosaminyltransferase [Thermoanaerobaculia bacterium]